MQSHVRNFVFGLFLTLGLSAQASWNSLGPIGGMSSYPKASCSYRLVSKYMSPNLYLYPRSVSPSSSSTILKFSADVFTLFWATYSSTRNIYTSALAQYNSVSGPKDIYLLAQVGAGFQSFGIEVDFPDANGNPSGRGFTTGSDVWAYTFLEENCN